MEYGEIIPARRAELGSFLRTRRNRIDPRDLGFPAGGRRHVKGLRREELAEAAGIGASWYTLLEQGRAPNVSQQTLTRIADALRLNDCERRHVFELADRLATHARTESASLPASVVNLTRRYAPEMAMLVAPSGEIVAWNEAADALFRFSKVVGQINLIERIALDVRCRAMFVDPGPIDVLRAFLAHARALSASTPIPELYRLAERLSAASPVFAAVWAEREIGDAPNGYARMNDPRSGETIEVDVVSLMPALASRHILFVLARR